MYKAMVSAISGRGAGERRERGRRGGLVDRWRVSSACPEGPDCVQVAMRSDGVAVRDSKDPMGPMLTFTESEWSAFLAGVRAGDFDLERA